MTSGQVIFVSGNQGMFVVQHDDGFAVIELLGDEGALEVGVAVSGDWSDSGSGTIRANAESYDVFFQGSWGSRDTAISIAKRSGGG